jgi:hypothetical protein
LEVAKLPTGDGKFIIKLPKKDEGNFEFLMLNFEWGGLHLLPDVIGKSLLPGQKTGD